MSHIDCPLLLHFSQLTFLLTRTIKVTLAKWLQETGAPLAGRAAVSANEDQNDPWSHGYSPYEMMFGRPSPLIREVKGNLLPRGGMRRDRKSVV